MVLGTSGSNGSETVDPPSASDIMIDAGAPPLAIDRERPASASQKMRTLKEAMPKGHCEKGRAGPVVQPAFALPRRIAVQCARGPACLRRTLQEAFLAAVCAIRSAHYRWGVAGCPRTKG